MKKSKLFTILIAVAFGLTLVLSCVFLLVVKRIEVEFTVEENIDAESLQTVLDEKYRGKTYASVNVEEVTETVAEFPYFSLLSVDKYFPNVIKVKVSVRRESYVLESGGDKYLLDVDGYVLSKNGERTQSTETIELKLEGITVESAEVGKKLKTDKDELLTSAFSMAKEVGLSDCITETKVVFGMAGEERSVFFSTRTGVEIEVVKADENGVGKAVSAFTAYDNNADDYQKSYSKILAYTEVGGEIVIKWTDRG